MKEFFVHNWQAKVISLLISLSIWYLIADHLKEEPTTFPVPGTGSGGIQGSTNKPPAPLEDSILTPFSPPVPGGNE